jgi:hypothetical protein
MNLKNRIALRPPVKKLIVFTGWIAGLILAGVLLWAFTQPARHGILLNSVNRILSSRGEEARLETPLPSWGMPGRAVQAGTWFATTTPGVWAVIFTVPSGGILSPILAFFSPDDGTAASFIPLSVHGEAVFRRLPPGQLRVYALRLEKSYATLRRAWEGKNE